MYITRRTCEVSY